MGRVISSSSFLFSICFPPAETRHTHGLPVFLHLVLPVCSLFLFLSRHCEARGSPSAAGAGDQVGRWAFNVAATSPLCILRLGCSLLEAHA